MFCLLVSEVGLAEFDCWDGSNSRRIDFGCVSVNSACSLTDLIDEKRASCGEEIGFKLLRFFPLLTFFF